MQTRSSHLSALTFNIQLQQNLKLLLIYLFATAFDGYIQDVVEEHNCLSFLRLNTLKKNFCRINSQM